MKNAVRSFTGQRTNEQRTIERAERLFAQALSETDGTRRGETKYNLSQATHITPDMTESERYNILKNKTITAPTYNGEADVLIAQTQSNLDNVKKKIAKATIRRIGEEFGVFTDGNERLPVDDMGFEVSFSRGSVDESLNKRITDSAFLAKLLPVLETSVKNSIGLESHNNRYFADRDTSQFYELLGGYFEGNDFVPVRFGVKATQNGDYRLYVVVCQDKIKEIRHERRGDAAKAEHWQRHNLISNISISEIAKNVNSKDLLRYFPDGFLNDEQRIAKKEGIAETARRTAEKNDYYYNEALIKGDTDTVRRMVDEAAKAAGYTIKAYHGTGADFNSFDVGKVGGRNVWGDGFYFATHKALADDYAEARAQKGGTKRIVNAFLKMENSFSPDTSELGTAQEIYNRWFSDMWKSFPELGYDYINDKLNNNKLDLLSFIAEHNKISVGEVLREYGYDSVKDGGELVVFNPAQIKSADPITYDDNGNVIPLSKRFSDSEDIRYSLMDAGFASWLEEKRQAESAKQATYETIPDYKPAQTTATLPDYKPASKPQPERVPDYTAAQTHKTAIPSRFHR